jgi:GR25 family glycosyltransferase involved in LPS biosynthesis
VSTYVAPDGYRMGEGPTATWLSHRALWEHCLQESDDAFLLMEDDVVLVDEFARRLRELLAKLPSGWDFCYVGIIDEGPGIANKLGPAVAPGLYRPRDPYGTHCYLVTRQGLRQLQQLCPRLKNHVDIQIYQDALPHMNWYAAWPTLAHQRSQNGEWPSLP